MKLRFLLILMLLCALARGFSAEQDTANETAPEVNQVSGGAAPVSGEIPDETPPVETQAADGAAPAPAIDPTLMPGQTGEKHFFPALGFNLLINGVVFAWNSLIWQSDFAMVSKETVSSNLRGPWEWDTDDFLTNQFGHPYAGALYHQAARTNGFTFYESALFDAFGSAFWEVFAETTLPSLNDFITTTVGGAIFGEIMHRLYYETSNIIAATLISPPDTLNNLFFGKSPERKPKNLYHFSLSAGAGWAMTKQKFHAYPAEDALPIFMGNVGANIIYRNPFVQSTWKPFEHFEMHFLAGIGGAARHTNQVSNITVNGDIWYDWISIMEGYLFSFNPLNTENKSASTGLSLNFDIFSGIHTGFSSEALDWSFKYQYLAGDGRFELKTRAGWMFFGSALYFPRYHVEQDGMITQNKVAPNFGTGTNIQVLLALAKKDWGEINFGAYCYWMPILTWTHYQSGGTELFNFFSLSYSYPITEKLSISIINLYNIKNAWYKHYPNVHEWTNRLTALATWTFFNEH